MSETTAITVIRGDGIGPEIMDAALRVLEVLDGRFEYDFQLAGLAAQEDGGSLLPDETMASIERTRLVLKGPLTTPVGGGFRSLNVELRRRFDLYANVRPAISFPGTRARYDEVDLITVRENTEGAYLAADAFTSEDGTRAESKMVATRSGCERVLRYAFELARRAGRRKVTAVHKANILKDVTGLFLNVAREMAEEYPEVAFDDIIVDNCCMQLVMNPERFDVMVTTNLFGDIISDLCAGLVGGLGLAPGANIGRDVAMFEAVHGSAPDIAGQGIANPCALILATAQMLDHLERQGPARRLRNAVREVIRSGDRVTPDLGGTATTAQFGDAIIDRLGA
jgi:isocitrate dehydrogenase (NAD+)